MKDIQRLNIWPLLKERGFRLHDYKTGNIITGRGASLHTPIIDIEIEPIDHNKWRLFNGHITEYVNAFELSRKIQMLLR